MEINIGDEIVTRWFRYVVKGFRPNGKIVARNPHWGKNDSCYGMEVMPDHLAEYVAAGLCRVIKKDAVLV